MKLILAEIAPSLANVPGALGPAVLSCPQSHLRALPVLTKKYLDATMSTADSNIVHPEQQRQRIHRGETIQLDAPPTYPMSLKEPVPSRMAPDIGEPVITPIATTVSPIPMRRPTSGTGPIRAKGWTRSASVAPVEMLVHYVNMHDRPTGSKDEEMKRTHPRKMAIATNEAMFVANGHVNVTTAAIRVAGMRMLSGPKSTCATM